MRNLLTEFEEILIKQKSTVHIPWEKVEKKDDDWKADTTFKENSREQPESLVRSDAEDVVHALPEDAAIRIGTLWVNNYWTYKLLDENFFKLDKLTKTRK